MENLLLVDVPAEYHDKFKFMAELLRNQNLKKRQAERGLEVLSQEEREFIQHLHSCDS